MSSITRLLLFIILPFIAVLSFPPDTLAAALPILGVAAVVFVVLGLFLWRGRSLALTLSIFIQGLNIIIRLMMFFPNVKPANGPLDVMFMVTSIIGIVLSAYLMFRLDQSDVRAEMVT